jgi:hypothetical protein
VEREIAMVKKRLFQWIAKLILLGALCGCETTSTSTNNKKAQEIVFEVAFYSAAQKSSPLVSLRGDNKLFVVWVKQGRKDYDYEGKFLDIHKDDAAVLKEEAIALLKWAGTNAAPIPTNGVVLTLTIPSEKARKEIGVMPGKNRQADELFESVNEILPQDQKIIWK